MTQKSLDEMDVDPSAKQAGDVGATSDEIDLVTKPTCHLMLVSALAHARICSTSCSQ